MRHDENYDLRDQPAGRQRNLHDTMIGCVALPIIAYAIMRLLFHLLG